MASLRMGGQIIVAGATGGANIDFDIRALFLNQQRVIGTIVGGLVEFKDMLKFMEANKLRPQVDQIVDMADARSAFEAMYEEKISGKFVLANK